jgi:hypothetical protein
MHQLDQEIARIAEDLQMFVGDGTFQDEISFIAVLPAVLVRNESFRHVRRLAWRGRG